MKHIPIPDGPGIVSILNWTFAPDGSFCGGYWCPRWGVEATKYHFVLVGFSDEAAKEIAVVIPHTQFIQFTASVQPPSIRGGLWVFEAKA